MILVYLIRHAIAYERDGSRWRDDRQRPLTPRGKAKFRRGARGLARLAGPVGCLLTSPLVRARQTADILHREAGWPQPLERTELVPGRTCAQVLALLRGQKAGVIALVGHEPDLSRLLAVCVSGPEGALSCRFRKGAAACLSFESEPRAGRATLEWLAAPKLLRMLGKAD